MGFQSFFDRKRTIFADYQRLAAKQPGIIDLLGEPAGIEDTCMELSVSRELARPALLD